MTAEDVRATARRVVSDDDAGTTLGNSLDLDGVERRAAILGQGLREFHPGIGDVCREGVERLRITNDDKIPRLRVSHARRAMGGVENAHQSFVGDDLSRELGANVSPSPNRFVHGYS